MRLKQKTTKPADQVIADGGRAEAVLRDPVFVEATEMAREQIQTAWTTAKTVEAREQAHAQYVALDHIVSMLQVMVDRAQVEALKIKRDQQFGPAIR